MLFGIFRCPECRTTGHDHDVSERFSLPIRHDADGVIADMFPEERVCLACGAWLWVDAGGWPLRRTHAMSAAIIICALANGPEHERDEHLSSVLAGVLATDSFREEFASMVALSSHAMAGIVPVAA